MNATTDKPDTTTTCRCGCGQITAKMYKQGHDARHVSILASLVRVGEMTSAEASDRLGSDALRTKLAVQVHRLDAKAEAAAARREKAKGRTIERQAREAAREAKKAAKKYTQVKIGRWTYEVDRTVARKDGNFDVVYITKSGEKADATVAADKLS